jgi:alpha/beta superfamily hydrolase
MEEKIFFRSEDNQLEGFLAKGNGAKGVVITHPHPLYGGDMYNSVVTTIAQSYQKKGYTTLRFNFRGVGHSQGTYDAGEGEQQDVRAALSFLRDRDIDQIDLAGYSFGTWVNARLAADEVGIQNMAMVSPPVAFLEFDGMGPLEALTLIVTGSRDDIAPADIIARLHARWNPKAHFEVIEGADHFYGGYLDRLQKILVVRI